MKLWMSGEIHIDVGDDYRQARAKIEKSINEALNPQNYGEGVQKWNFIAIILPQGWGENYPEVKKYNRKGRSIEFRLKIDFDEFRVSSSIVQEKLICQSLLRSLKLVREMNIENINLDNWEGDFMKAAFKEGWL